jgi:hypothetical protein
VAAAMTALVRELLDTFDRLTDSERLDLASEILKRTIHLDFPPLSDEDLVLNAEAIFLELDEQEDSFGQSCLHPYIH